MVRLLTGISSLSNSPRIRSAPKTSIVCCHLLDQVDGLKRRPRLSQVRIGFVLPEYMEELTMLAQKRFRLDDEERLFPGSDHPGQKHQEKPICLLVDRSFDLSTKDDQLLS